MANQIILVEDDEFFVEEVKRFIRERWPGVFEFLAIANEKAFAARFEDFAKHPPKLFIIDQMIPYTFADDPDWQNALADQNPFRGGTRCVNLLRQDPRTKNIPAIFWTILDPETVPNETTYVKKTGDRELTELLDEVERVVGKQTPRGEY